MFLFGIIALCVGLSDSSNAHISSTLECKQSFCVLTVIQKLEFGSIALCVGVEKTSETHISSKMECAEGFCLLDVIEEIDNTSDIDQTFVNRSHFKFALPKSSNANSLEDQIQVVRNYHSMLYSLMVELSALGPPAKTETETEAKAETNENNKSEIVKMDDGSYLIEPILEYEVPELVPYFGTAMAEEYHYKQLYKVLFRCANGNKAEKYLSFVDTYFEIDSVIKNSINRIMMINKHSVKASKIANLQIIMKKKCEEFQSGEHPLAKKLAEMQKN